jgi:hypothetical protein
LVDTEIEVLAMFGRMAMKKNVQHGVADQQRVDANSEDVVECAIAMQAHYNTVCALEYLKSHNVGADIIERVLLHPQLRRKARR